MLLAHRQALETKHTTPACNEQSKHLTVSCWQVMKDIVQAAQDFQKEASIAAIVLTGEGNKAFAAGADIKEMATKTYSQV